MAASCLWVETNEEGSFTTFNDDYGSRRQALITTPNVHFIVRYSTRTSELTTVRLVPVCNAKTGILRHYSGLGQLWQNGKLVSRWLTCQRRCWKRSRACIWALPGCHLTRLVPPWVSTVRSCSIAYFCSWEG